jgi:hypothetical protein
MSDWYMNPVRFGKCSMALLERHRDFLTESVRWTFTTP